MSERILATLGWVATIAAVTGFVIATATQSAETGAGATCLLIAGFVMLGFAELEGPPACESIYERRNGAPEHEAHWWAQSPCGEVLAVCTRRRDFCRHQGGWTCTGDHGGTGCRAHHDYDDIWWEKIT